MASDVDAEPSDAGVAGDEVAAGAVAGGVAGAAVASAATGPLTGVASGEPADWDGAFPGELVVDDVPRAERWTDGRKSLAGWVEWTWRTTSGALSERIKVGAGPSTTAGALGSTDRCAVIGAAAPNVGAAAATGGVALSGTLVGDVRSIGTTGNSEAAIRWTAGAGVTGTAGAGIAVGSDGTDPADDGESVAGGVASGIGMASVALGSASRWTGALSGGVALGVANVGVTGLGGAVDDDGVGAASRCTGAAWGPRVLDALGAVGPDSVGVAVRLTGKGPVGAEATAVVGATGAGGTVPLPATSGAEEIGAVCGAVSARGGVAPDRGSRCTTGRPVGERGTSIARCTTAFGRVGGGDAGVLVVAALAVAAWGGTARWTGAGEAPPDAGVEPVDSHMGARAGDSSAASSAVDR